MFATCATPVVAGNTMKATSRKGIVKNWDGENHTGGKGFEPFFRPSSAAQPGCFFLGFEHASLHRGVCWYPGRVDSGGGLAAEGVAFTIITIPKYRISRGPPKRNRK